MINSGRVVSYAIPARPVVSYGASLLLQRRGAPRLGTATPPHEPPSTHRRDFRFSYRCLGTFAIKTSLFNRGKPPQNINDRSDLQIKRIH